jgi:DNA polymerase-3 subunit gamma/tau
MADLLETHNRHVLAAGVRNRLRAVRYAAPDIVASSAVPLPADFLRDLAGELRTITGKTWKVTADAAPGEPTVVEQRAATQGEEREAVLTSPVVAAALEAFPQASLERWNLTGSI